MTEKQKLEELKELADAMYYAAQYLTTDASRLRKTMKDYYQFIIQEWHKEESVSKDLEQEIHNEAMKLRTSPCYEELEAFARHFVEWGRNHHEPVSEDLEKSAKEYVVKEAAKDISWNWTTNDILNAFKAGAQWQKEQFEKEL